MEKDLAIKVDNLRKTFKIPHERISTLRGAFINVFKNKTYEEFEALDKVSFEVKKGEFVGIIGRNGSGKSTLLKLLAGIYKPDAGEVRINGLISPFLELGIGFQPELSGRDNIYLNATVLGLTKKQIDDRFDDIVDFSELRRFIDQKIKNYSSGMQVRLAFSVAIHANRDILLMDEVLAVGDINFQRKCFEVFFKYRDQGKTILLVTHDVGQVQQYCDRAILLRYGRVAVIGSPEKIVTEYISQNIEDAKKKNNKIKSAGEELPKATQRETPVEITGVEFIDENGKEKEIFQTGDDFSIRINFRRNIEVEYLNFGLRFIKDNRGFVCGYNTQMDKVIVSETDQISFYIKDLPLLQGNYYLDVFCFGRVEQDVFDHKDKMLTLRVFPMEKNSKYRGMVNIKHIWK